jgi:hypothetical protein
VYREANSVFKDAYDRVINIGDVIVSGARVGCIGSVRTCVVTGFTTKSVTVLVVTKIWKDALHEKTKWVFQKSYIKATEHCVITPYTQDMIMNELGII